MLIEFNKEKTILKVKQLAGMNDRIHMSTIDFKNLLRYLRAYSTKAALNLVDSEEQEVYFDIAHALEEL
jgi:hypothetical protein